jgi:SET domain-containing protein
MKKKMTAKRPQAVGVRAGRSSAGLGLFATKDFKKGERIIEYIGNRVPTGDDGPVNLYIFNVNKKIDIDGSPRWNTARYANHSCVPNAEAVNDNDRIFIEAIKRIETGEEITYDYGKEYYEDILVKEKGGCLCPKHVAKTKKKR